MARGEIAVVSAQALRAEWADRSMSASWAFPSDWDSPGVDAVCEALAADQDVFPPAERLGRLRAAAGVALGEALADIDQLVTLIPSRHAEVLRRAVSLGWADRVVGPGADISDPLTGLVSREYLQLRLAEVYQAAAARGVEVPAEFALVVVRVDLTGRDIWQRVLPMILVGECMRIVFDAGETLARLGEPMAVALVARSGMFSRRVQLLNRLITSRTSSDPDCGSTPPRVWIESLPSSYPSCCSLLAELGR
jgi:hypothetical protein